MHCQTRTTLIYLRYQGVSSSHVHLITSIKESVIIYTLHISKHFYITPFYTINPSSTSHISSPPKHTRTYMYTFVRDLFLSQCHLKFTTLPRYTCTQWGDKTVKFSSLLLEFSQSKNISRYFGDEFKTSANASPPKHTVSPME